MVIDPETDDTINCRERDDVHATSTSWLRCGGWVSPLQGSQQCRRACHARAGREPFHGPTYRAHKAHHGHPPAWAHGGRPAAEVTGERAWSHGTVTGELLAYRDTDPRRSSASPCPTPNSRPGSAPRPRSPPQPTARGRPAGQ
jgi:hypothetical protein